MAKKSTTTEDWMTKKWRPMMAITYMVINICDFILFPILWTLVQFDETQVANDAFRQWNPMSLQSGGLIHIAFGAILGISAWTRGQEKVAQVAAENEGKNRNNRIASTEDVDNYNEPEPTRRNTRNDEE